MSAIIYLLTNTVNGKQYVGQTSYGLEKRWREHCQDARRGFPRYLYNAIRKYGPDAFTYEILEHTTIEDVNARETYWISELKTLEHGYNMTEGGGGVRGWVPSEDTRAKMSAAKTGKTFSAETRAKLRAALTGKTHSAETRAKMSAARSGENNPNYGKTHSAETRAKLSAANIGKKLSAKTRAKMRAALSGENNPFYGKKLSPESIAKRTATRKLRARMKRIVAPEASIYVC